MNQSGMLEGIDVLESVVKIDSKDMFLDRISKSSSFKKPEIHIL